VKLKLLVVSDQLPVRKLGIGNRELVIEIMHELRFYALCGLLR